MDDHGDLLRAILSEQSSQRANINALCVQSARVEGQLSSLCERLDDLREHHDRVCVEIASTDTAMSVRIGKIEQSAAWVRAWSAGAAAMVTAIFGVLAWIVSTVGGR